MKNITLLKFILILIIVEKTFQFESHGIDSSQILNLDEQCKILFGKEASFCKSNLKEACKNLYCRKSINQPCFKVSTGARERTLCDSGKICFQGICTKSQTADVGECLFGDDLVRHDVIGMNLPYPQMDCKDVLKYASLINQSSTAYCTNSNFRQICCQTCKKYDILSCIDRYYDCSRYKNTCETSTINGIVASLLCPRTCGKCSGKPAFCIDNMNICKNEGKCLNISVSNDELFGFKCECQIGYYGDLCEYKDSCLPNPCNQNEECISFGNIAYKCVKNHKTSLNTILTIQLNTTKINLLINSTSNINNLSAKMNNQKTQNCINFDEEICKYYSNQSLCDSSYFINGEPITKKCAKSCLKC